MNGPAVWIYHLGITLKSCVRGSCVVWWCNKGLSWKTIQVGYSTSVFFKYSGTFKVISFSGQFFVHAGYVIPFGESLLHLSLNQPAKCSVLLPLLHLSFVTKIWLLGYIWIFSLSISCGGWLWIGCLEWEKAAPLLMLSPETWLQMCRGTQHVPMLRQLSWQKVVKKTNCFIEMFLS